MTSAYSQQQNPAFHQKFPHSHESKPQNLCPICLTTTSNDEIIQLPNCCHSFCKDCLQQYLKLEISSLQKIFKIKCPEDTCTEIFTSNILQSLLDQPDFEKYQKLLAIKTNPHNQTKFCPKSGCSKPLNITLNSPFTLCSCGILVCNQCCNPWHEGKNCLEALDVEFEEYMESNNIRFCFMCKTTVAKVEGCPHITCPICDYEWCWLCGQEHSEMHASECTRVWSPVAPKVIMKEDEGKQSPPKTLPKRVLLLCLEQFFWPIFILDIVETIKTETIRAEAKFEKSALAIFLNVIYILTFFFIKQMIEMFPEEIDTFLWSLVGVLVFPWLVKGIEWLKNFRNKNTKRWMKRNLNLFNYTTGSRPGVSTSNQVNGIPEDLFAIDIQNDEEEDLDAYIF